MLQIAFFLLSISICVFAWIMIRDPRTLWSGISLLGMLLCSAAAMFVLLSEYANWLAEHELLMNILVVLLVLTAGCVLMFPVILIVTLFVEGIKVIRHEGLRPSNLLAMLFSSRLMEKDRPKVAVVTTSYHVFRTLLLAKQQGLKCVGYGAKTKWYFTLNALIREFAGYLHLTWKRHIFVAAVITVIAAIAA